MSPESEQNATPVVVLSSTAARGVAPGGFGRGAVGLLGGLFVMILLLGGAADAFAAPSPPRQVTATILDDANRAELERAPMLAGGEDRQPSSSTQAIGAQEPGEDDESEGKGRRKFVIGGVLVAIVIAVVVVVVLRRRGDDED